ncbi:MAG: TylF/MycF family methyltransferase [Simkaniaceae bacterium]|nr:TylF/MycF family methyltransferase [Simkaniaceae bacterium]
MRLLLILFFLSSIHAANLPQDCLSLIDRYSDGSIYIDQEEREQNKSEIEWIRKKNPYQGGYKLNEKKIRQEYLSIVKRIVRGVFELGEHPRKDVPNYRGIHKELRYTMVSGQAINTLWQLMKDVEERAIEGDFLEAGVWRGGVSIFMKAFIHAYENTKRHVWVADSFEGWPKIEDDPDTIRCNNAVKKWIMVSDKAVQRNFARCNLLDEKVHFLKGWFKDTLAKAPIEKLAILRLDGDLYSSTKESIEALYPKLAVGGYIIVDDYNMFPGCNQAIDEYRESHGITAPMYRQGARCKGVYWKKDY